MKISKQELKDLGACSDGLRRFMKQTGNTDEQVEVGSLIGGENTVSDLLWLAGKILNKERIVRFACDCALLKIDLIRPYTNDFNLIQDFLNNPERDAAYAARAAAYAADAAYAARAAARAAYAAARAADAAAYAAARAADAAAYAAAYAAAADAAAYAAAAYAAAAYAAELNTLLFKLFDGE